MARLQEILLIRLYEKIHIPKDMGEVVVTPSWEIAFGLQLSG